MLKVYVWAIDMLRTMREEKGQDLIEYGLLGGFIALVIIGLGVTVFQDPIKAMFAGIGTCIDFTAGGCTPF